MTKVLNNHHGGNVGQKVLALHRHQHTPQHQPQCRTIISSIVEPPLDSQVIEKPFTVLLMEDQQFLFDYSNDESNINNNGITSWRESFQKSISRNYGMSFAYLSYNVDHHHQQEESSSSSSFLIDAILEQLKVDLQNIPDAVLVTKGPISSWFGQLYLESFSLKGLVMVDPVLFDNQEETTNVRKFWDDETSTNFELLLLEATKRKLMVEPNSVPMLILSSEGSSENNNMEAASLVAKRHSDVDGPFGQILVASVEDTIQDDQKQPVDMICDWIDDTIY